MPKEVNQTSNGLLYGVGRKSDQENEKVEITIKGTLHKRLFSQDRFKGTIDIKGKVPKNIIINQKEVEVVFIENGGSLSFRDFSEPTKRTVYGNLYINKDFSELTIKVYEKIASRRDQVTWNPEDGQLISAPANHRKEALRVSNKLIGDLLKPLE